MTEVDDLIERISRECGKEKAEIEAMMNERKEATHGLLSDYGAIYAVAKRFGININGNEKTEITRISDIKPVKSINVAGRVKSVYLPKEFQRKDGSTGKYAGVVLIDGSSECRLVLGDGNTEIANRVARNDILMLRNAYVKKGMSGEPEVHAGSMSIITLNPKPDTLDITLPEVKDNLVKIGKLKKDMTSLDLICRVFSYYPTTEFTRSDGTTGFRASFIGQDDTGEIRVILWDESAKTGFSAGDFVRIENAYTREGMNQGIELQVGNQGRIIKTDAKLNNLKLNLPPLPKDSVLKIGEIGTATIVSTSTSTSTSTTPTNSTSTATTKSGSAGFATMGRVLRVYKPREYSNGMMASLILGDDSGTIRVVLWNEKSEVANELNRGDAIKIQNTYSRSNLNNEPEIHVGKYGEVIINQELDIPSLSVIERSLITEKKIADLGNGDKYIKINGKIVDIDEGRRLFYTTCSKCNRKVQNMGDGWFCESCNENVEPAQNMILSFIIEDDTGRIRAISFRETAEKILGMDIEEVMNMIGETQDEGAPIKQAKEILLDKGVPLIGSVRYSDFSDQLEFIVDSAEF